MRISNLSKNPLFLTIIVYLILGFILLGYYQHQINPDGVGYIQTALKYLHGDLNGAINAYWGPLLSWLLVPFLYFNQTPEYALFSSKILSIIIGFFTLIGVYQLSKRFKMDKVVLTTVLLIISLVLIYFSLSVITPDLLVVCVLVYYLSIIFNPQYPHRLSYGILCGFLGAVAFLAKSYLFPFFAVQFLVMNLLHYHYRPDQDRIRITRNMFIGLMVFLLLSGAWVGLISSKEGKLTFGTSGEYNHALVGPGSNGFPQFSQGLSAPGEIDQQKVIKNWNPFNSGGNFNHQMGLIWINLIFTLSIYQFFSYLSILIIFCSIILLTRPFKKYSNSNSRETIVFTLLTILIYSGGYLPVLVEERYLWPVYILIIMLGGLLISILFNEISLKNQKINKSIKASVIGFFALSFILMPLSFLYTNVNTGKDVYVLSKSLNDQYGVQGNIATNDQLLETQFIAFYLKSTSFGQSKKDISDQELETQLLRYKIDYYLVWGNAPINLINYSEISNGKLKGLRVYRRN